MKYNQDATNSQLTMILEACENLQKSLRRIQCEGTFCEKTEVALREAQRKLDEAYICVCEGRGWNIQGFDGRKDLSQKT